MALNVLVTDDSAVMRSIIIKTLRLSGIPLGEVLQASNGAEGLQKVKENWLDLAIVDINMPVMDGEEMMRQIRSDPETADLPMIVVSTESSETRIDMLKRNGIQFVHKPFTPESLLATILEVTGESDAQSFGNSDLRDSSPDF
jgi:two-component system chemotaxis response regulator CheY